MSKTVLITGASSGIGLALAEGFAARGYSLGLMARRLERLEEIKQKISLDFPGIKVEVAALDVADDRSILPVMEGLVEKLGNVDIIVANAGTTAVNRTGAGDFEVDRQVMQVNLLGAMATIDAAAKIFRSRGGGHIVGISSVSAFFAIPGSAAYSGSKAGLSNYMSAVRSELRNKNIAVTVIHPGFIKTDLVSNMEKYPFVVPADKAARQMIAAIEKKKPKATIPSFPWVPLTVVGKLLPERLVSKMF